MDSRSMEQATMSIHCNLLRVVIPFWCLILMYCRSPRYNSNGGLYRKPAIRLVWTAGQWSRLLEHTLQFVKGCDSILVLNFDILPEFRDTIPMADCIGNLPFDWYGQQVNGAGYYEHTLQSVKGCDSILVLNFDILPEFRDTIPIADCIGNLPFDWYGQQVNGGLL